MKLSDLTFPLSDYTYAFLDTFAKHELRRRILKAIALPGYQVPYASREVPMARGWGTGGLQVTLALVGPQDVVKVIDQGDDDSVNAANLRRFVSKMTGVQTTTHTLEATLIQSRHRVPEEVLGEHQTLVLQVPMPEVLANAGADASYARAREMHADAEYELLFLRLYEDLITYFQSTHGADYPVWVNGRYAMAPSPIPRWDTLKLHQAAHLTLLSAGREKRLYAVPPYTEVHPLEFDDVPFEVEDQCGWQIPKPGVGRAFMNEIPLEGGASHYEISDSDFREKVARLEAKLEAKLEEEGKLGQTYFDERGEFYIPGVLVVKP